jgi:hypothetical protein
MRALRIAVLAAGLGLAVQTQAGLYDVSFSGGGSVANGQIDVESGVAVSGYLDVTAGAAQGTYSLYTWSGGGISSVRVTGGTDLIVDNIVNAGANPFLDVYGMAFVNSGHTEGIDFSINYGTTYNLAGFGSLGYGVPNANGSATITAVPEPTTMVAGVGAVGLVLAGMARSRRSPVVRMGE